MCLCVWFGVCVCGACMCVWWVCGWCFVAVLFLCGLVGVCGWCVGGVCLCEIEIEIEI